MKHNVLITGIGGGGVGRQIIKAIKLTDLPVKLFGSDTSTVSFGKMDVDDFFLLPSASDEDYISTLLSKCIQDEIKVIFPGSEDELIKIASSIKKFETQNIYVPINSKRLIDMCLNKFKCNELLLENGFNCPRSLIISKIEDIDSIDFFPLVLKPSCGAGGSANVFIVQNKNELKVFSSYLLINDITIIAQEYIGNADNEYTVGVLSSTKGDIISSIVLKRHLKSGLGYKLGVKNKTPNNNLGKRLIISSGISQGEFIERSFINETCEKIATAIGSNSAINVQGRIHNGKFYVFEINPRFSGTTSARAIVGYNEPEILLNEILFNIITEPYFKYKLGLVYRGLNERYITK